MLDSVWLKGEKSGEDLLLCLEDSIKQNYYFEINKRDAETSYNYIVSLKRALNEIREYIKENCIEIDGKYTEIVCEGDNILQIIDKALGDDEK